MPTYSNALTQQPANRLAYQDTIGPVPRNEYLGALADFLAQSYSPERTQQMQGVARFLGAPAVSQTLDRLSYGEPLTTGRGMTTQVRPEVLEAAMAVAPAAKPVTMASLQAARLARQAALATKGLPVGMSTEAVGGMGFLRPGAVAPQDEALRLAEQRALQMGQSANPEVRMLQQGYEPDWYHGTTGDITRFRRDLLGESTGAESAKKGFFFARDPQNPPASMLNNVQDKEILQFLQQGGLSPQEIAQSASMKGHGAETAVGYAKMGGSREYKNALRQARSAEKSGNWDEYEKQMAIAEDSAIKRNQNLQSLVASYGDKRDVMLDEINKAFLNKKLPQEDAVALDKQLKKLMPDYWYTKDPQKHLPSIKAELIKNVGQDKAKPALNAIDDFMKNYNERMLMEHTEEGGNVMPVALRYKKPMVHDFGGNSYRDQTYSDLVDQALRGGHDALILKNTFDPGAGPSKLIDVGVVFDPDQIRSRFAAFDPLRKTAATAAAAGLAAPDLLAGERQDNINQMRKFKANQK